ncbi:MAG: DUF1292 domain-containing protein, partial [Clostridia bacterium]|nr:DUF1292 domain-containing protein [Clostridia bacterium]
HFTQPPARFTEGSLVKVMKDMGIGRPSTYTATITTIISRGYIRRDGKFLVPTELGFVTTEMMKKAFEQIVDYNFTANVEEELDRIESDGGKHYVALLPVYGDDEEILDGDDELFVLEVIEEDGETYLQQIEDEDELFEIGDIMFERIKKKYPFLVGEDEE